jgi:branched-chain amino acid transport system substrate-binding protein
MQRSFRVFGLVISYLVLTCVCAQVAAAREIVIAQSLDLSGQTNLGKDFSNGLRTYFDAINEKGGVRGRRINLIQLDDTGDPAVTAANLNRLLRENNVDVLIAPTSARSLFAAASDAAFRNSGLTLIGAPTGARSAGIDNPRVLHIRASYRDEARQLLTHMSTLGMKAIALVGCEGEESEFAVVAFRAEAQARGVALAFDGSALQWRARPAKSAAIEAVVIVGDAIGVADTVQHSRKAVKEGTLFGFSMIDHRTLLEIAKRDATGMIISQAMPAADKSVHAFQREHREQMKRFRDEPPSLHTLEGYVVARYLTNVLLSVDADPTAASVSAALRRNQTLDLGAMSIIANANSNAIRFVNLSAISTRGQLIE